MVRDTYNPFYDASAAVTRSGPPRLRFSAVEVQHIIVAVIVLTVAFAYLLADGLSVADRTVDLLQRPIVALASLLAVASGFVLHELAHKVVAQRYGHWAEFRAWFAGLLGSIVMAVLLKILIAAPGAVHILGRVTPRENGLISIVGPGVNIVIAAAAMPFTFATDIEAGLPMVMGTVALVNTFLAVFNLLPFGPFDGRKVWRWSRPTWLVAFLVSLAMLFFVVSRVLVL